MPPSQLMEVLYHSQPESSLYFHPKYCMQVMAADLACSWWVQFHAQHTLYASMKLGLPGASTCVQKCTSIALGQVMSCA